jgi:hypothetical protein
LVFLLTSVSQRHKGRAVADEQVNPNPEHGDGLITEERN